MMAFQTIFQMYVQDDTPDGVEVIFLMMIMMMKTTIMIMIIMKVY